MRDQACVVSLPATTSRMKNDAISPTTAAAVDSSASTRLLVRSSWWLTRRSSAGGGVQGADAQLKSSKETVRNGGQIGIAEGEYRWSSEMR